MFEDKIWGIVLYSMAIHSGRRGIVDIGDNVRFDYAKRRGVAQETVPVARGRRIGSCCLTAALVWLLGIGRHVRCMRTDSSPGLQLIG